MKYENVLAEACFIAGNIAACIRSALESNNDALIVDAWIVLDNDDESKALASLRSNLNRESKKIYGHGLKVDVKEGKLVAVKPRNRKKKEESPFMMVAKNADAKLSAEILAKLVIVMNDELKKVS